MALASDTIYRNTFQNKRYTLQRSKRSYIEVMQKQKLHHFCNRSSPDEGLKSVRSTWDMYNYGKYVSQFWPNTIKAIRQYEWINKKICRHMSIMFNEICINKEMLPINIYIYIYIYIYEITY